MAQRIVNRLEVVQIEKQHRGTDRTVGLSDCHLDPFAEHDPVRQPGQSVVPRHEDHLLFGTPARGDIQACDDPAVLAGERQTAYLDDDSI